MARQQSGQTAPEHVRSTAVDRHHSRLRSAFVLGPVDVPTVEQARDRLCAMAAAGPHTRVGLHPRADRRIWEHDRDADLIVVTEADDPGDDPLRLLDAVRTDGTEPLRVAFGGDHVAVDFDHGLGDAGMLHTLFDVMMGVTDPADPGSWQRFRHRVPPLALAAARVGADPRRLIALARLLRKQPDLPQAGEPASESGAMPGPVLASLRPRGAGVGIDADTLTAVRAARDTTMPGVSLYTLTTVALVDALTEAGVHLAPTVTAPFDARVYLPKSWDTLANFSAGLAFPVPAGSDPADFQNALRTAAEIGRPVANLLITTVKTLRAGTSPAHLAEAAPAPATGTTDLLHSSVGYVPRAGRWRWLDDDRAQVLAVADPPHRSGLTVTSALVGGRMCLAAAFHTEHLAAETISRALSRVPDHLLRLSGARPEPTANDPTGGTGE
ncbi:hypothetical protein [Gordonia sp. NB41Y]|uniref:hypothetical protein n=1 Tax=Gordonia sp. NB41Y TaxID=875808 RepID=UPI001651AC2E|nr:hypothetical protein [Gordonia sp. NB41Y]WLP89502.1 hypothetical protein Q9K23_18235 [Gordonia sp. NB41Y]